MIVIILLIAFFILIFTNLNENFNDNTKTNKYVVLLTMCVKPNQQDWNNQININEEAEYRKKLYSDVINKWLNYTNYDIFVIESSGYTFPDIKHDKLHVISFNLESQSNSSIAESKSILYALDKIKDININYTHILKVTGKYYLDNIEKTLNDLPNNYDIYTQTHINHDWQQINTEYYCIKKELYNDFAQTCGPSMESHMYQFVKDKKWMSIPKTFSNNIKRNCGNIITNL